MWPEVHRVSASNRALVCNSKEFFIQRIIQSRVSSIDRFVLINNKHIIYYLFSFHVCSDHRMMRMREHGLQERENARLYTQKPKCGGSGANFVTASLVDTKPAMLVLVWGMLFSISMFGIEILYTKLRKPMAHIQEHHSGTEREQCFLRRILLKTKWINF